MSLLPLFLIYKIFWVKSMNVLLGILLLWKKSRKQKAKQQSMKIEVWGELLLFQPVLSPL